MKLLNIIKEEDQKKISSEKAFALKKAEIYFKLFKKGTRYCKDLDTQIHYEIVETPSFKAMRSDDDVNYVPVIYLSQKFEEPIKIMVETNDGKPPYELKRERIGFNTETIWAIAARDVRDLFFKQGIMLIYH